LFVFFSFLLFCFCSFWFFCFSFVFLFFLVFVEALLVYPLRLAIFPLCKAFCAGLPLGKDEKTGFFWWERPATFFFILPEDSFPLFQLPRLMIPYSGFRSGHLFVFLIRLKCYQPCAFFSLEFCFLDSGPSIRFRSFRLPGLRQGVRGPARLLVSFF